MKIEIYIAQLLYRHDCVIVPKFGAFLTDFQSAQLIEKTNTFFPPRKTVSFNANLKNNDGLLANHISQIEKISFEKAVENIGKDVDVWKNNLAVKNSLVLDAIGKISLNVDNNLVFEPSDSTNFYSNSFGLNQFIAPNIKRQQLVQEDPLKEEVPVFELASAPKRNYNYLKYAAIFVVGFGTFGFFGNNYYQDKIAAETQMVQVAVQKEVQNKIQEATFFIKNPLPNVTLTVKESEMSFHVVAGSFRKERNAEKIFSKLTQLGFKARRLEKNDFGLFPVLYGSYATYAQAHEAMLTIKKEQSPEAWLMIKSL